VLGVTQTQTATQTTPLISQTTTMTYDGFARVKTKHVPQQDDGKATVYEYYPTDEFTR
jgi:YD repeat-containing protein